MTNVTSWVHGSTNNNGNDTADVYCASLPALISQTQSQASRGNDCQAWKGILGLGIASSAPLSIGGHLIAVGGFDGRDTTAMRLYQPDTGEWVKVGDLPTTRYMCTCAMISDREILVAGGRNRTNLDLAVIIP